MDTNNMNNTVFYLLGKDSDDEYLRQNLAIN